MSRTTKPAGNTYCFTLISTSSMIPSGYVTDLSARWMFEPISKNVLSNCTSPSIQGIVKLPGFFFGFGGNFLSNISLHSLVNNTFSCDVNFLLFVHASFKKFHIWRKLLNCLKQGNVDMKFLKNLQIIKHVLIFLLLMKKMWEWKRWHVTLFLWLLDCNCNRWCWWDYFGLLEVIFTSSPLFFTKSSAWLVFGTSFSWGP